MLAVVATKQREQTIDQEIEMRAYRIVVAVPTKNRLAFSPPPLVGWSLVELASGSVEARGNARS